MIWTLAWNTVQAEWNMQGYWGRYKRQGVVRPQCDTISVLFGWWHVSFCNRQTWLLIIFQSRHLLRLLSLNSTAGIQQLGFWICEHIFGAWNISETGTLALLITMGMEKRGFIRRREGAKVARFLLPWPTERGRKGCWQQAFVDLVHSTPGTLDLWYKLICFKFRQTLGFSKIILSQATVGIH